MITPENLVRHELIGLQVLIEKSANSHARGLEGRVVDESRNTLVLEVGDKEKTLAKEECTFVFTLPSGERVRVAGRVLVARPEDRIKKKQPGW
ncbi:MAG: ribonuclease P protein component 1 [Candidatus Aenigmarchaeota archaeon]|nr:ribonuclease P protein component 1 [Candidatus Aenigmarchaeota archaeon]